MKYATVEEVERGFRKFDNEEKVACEGMLEEAAVIIDAIVKRCDLKEAKKAVSCRMVRRAIGNGEQGIEVPLGATQGNIAALGYSQAWTYGNGTAGELYISKLEKQMLGIGKGDRIGVYSPVEGMVEHDTWS